MESSTRLLAREPSEAALTAPRPNWYYLLPRPAGAGIGHLVLLGASDESVEQVLAAGLAGQVTTELPRHRCADAVVMLHTRVESVAALAACLLPGGVLYCEFDRRHEGEHRTTPWRVTRQLRRLGLSPAGLYWVRPSFARCEAYIPLDSRAALEWYLAMHGLGGRLRQRLAEPFIRTLARHGRSLLRRIVGSFVVTAVAGAVGHPPVAVLGHAAMPSRVSRRGVAALLIAPRQRRAVFLPFADRHSDPLLVIKVARSPARNAETRKEQEILAAIGESLRAGMRRTVPRPLGSLDWNGMAVGVEVAVPGRPLRHADTRRGSSHARKIAHFEAVARWLGEFHGTVQLGRPGWGETDTHRGLGALIDEHRQCVAPTPAEDALFAATRAWSDSLLRESVPLVWYHADLNATNVLMAGDSLSVIDWAGAQPGLALQDLLFFALKWYHNAFAMSSPDARADGFRRLFLRVDRAEPARLAVHRAVRRYLERLEIDPRFLPLLLVILCLETSVHKFHRARMPGVRVDPAATAMYSRYLAMIAGEADRFFQVEA